MTTRADQVGDAGEDEAIERRIDGRVFVLRFGLLIMVTVLALIFLHSD